MSLDIATAIYNCGILIHELNLVRAVIGPVTCQLDFQSSYGLNIHLGLELKVASVQSR